MLTQQTLLFIALFLSVLVTACDTTTSDAEIETGMSQQDVIKMMGEPILTQSRTIDDLTATHVEWVDKNGTLSVQFINDKAQFNQFVETPDQ